MPTETRDDLTHQLWRQALPSLKAFLVEHPSCAEAHYMLGYVLLRADEPDASLKAYTQAATLRPPNSNDFTAIASDYIVLKAYPEAQRWLLQAVATPPVNAQAWYLLGRTQYNLDLNEAAVASFKQSLLISPKDARAEYNLGLAYERLQLPDRAREAYQAAIVWGEENKSADAQPYLDLGLLIRSQEESNSALPYLQKAAELAPRNALILQELGRTLTDLNRLDDAIAAFTIATKLAPSAAAPHLFLGRALHKAGKTEAAKTEFEIVQKLTQEKSMEGTPNLDTQ